MKNKAGKIAGFVSFIVTFILLLAIPDLSKELLERWFYNANPYWVFLVSITTALFLSLTIAAIVTVIDLKGKNIPRAVWFMLLWFPIFFVIIEAININKGLIHLIYSMVMESNEVTNFIVLILSIVVPYSIIFILLKLFSPKTKET